MPQACLQCNISSLVYSFCNLHSLRKQSITAIANRTQTTIHRFREYNWAGGGGKKGGEGEAGGGGSREGRALGTKILDHR